MGMTYVEGDKLKLVMIDVFTADNVVEECTADSAVEGGGPGLSVLIVITT